MNSVSPCHIILLDHFSLDTILCLILNDYGYNLFQELDLYTLVLLFASQEHSWLAEFILWCTKRSRKFFSQEWKGESHSLPKLRMIVYVQFETCRQNQCIIVQSSSTYSLY